MDSEEQDPHQTDAWSVWGVRLVALLSLMLAISLSWIWIEAFYRGVAANARLSFTSFDVPYIPGVQLHVAPIIGHHYFGDFQLPLNYATELRHSVSPYLVVSPDRYPPFAQVLFVPFTFLPLRASTFAFLALSAAVFLAPLWLILAPLKLEYRVLILVPVAVLTTPFVSFLDRGNNVGIAVGVVTWSLWAWKTERGFLCALFLVLAIALKAYPATLLVVPLALRRYKFTCFVAASAAAVNLLALALYPGGFARNLRAVFPALVGGYAPANQLSSWSLYSLVPKTVGLISGPSATTALLAPRGIAIWIPSLLYMGGLYVVVRRARVPQWCWGPLTLASMQLCVPVSFVYTTAWAAPAAVWFASGYLVGTRSDNPHERAELQPAVLRIMVLAAVSVTLAPLVFTIPGADGFETPLATFLSPLLLLLTLCVAIAYSLRPGKGNAISGLATRPL